MTPILLAGGDSTRFGNADKLIATVDGDPIVQHVVDVTRTIASAPPIVVVRRPGQRERIETALRDPSVVRFAFDDAAFSGPVGGIYGGTDRCETPWAFVCACDMPLVSSSAIDWLRKRVRRSRDAVVPVNSAGWLEPLHAVYRRSAVLEARGGLDPETGARWLLESLEEVNTVPVTESPVPLESSCTNVNTRAELEAIHDARIVLRPIGRVDR